MSYFEVIVSKFGGPEVLQVVKRDHVPEPSLGEVRIRMLASSVSFTDTLIRQNYYPIFVKPPFVPGYELVGEVDAIGEGVTHLNVGDRVAALTVIGGNSEMVCLKADQIVPFSKDIDPVEALCMVLSYMTAFQMLHRIANVKRGDVILIHGAGGVVGNALGQIGALAELKMFGTASKSKHMLLQEVAVLPIDYHNEDFIELIKRQYPEGIDAVFDPFGGDIARKSFKLLKRNGILIGFGFRNQAEGKMALVGLEILRLKLWNWLPNGKRTAFYSIADMRKKRLDWFREDLKHLFNLLKDGKLKPLIAAKIPITHAAEAHELVEKNRPSGKVILLPITEKL